jgi:haloalkane dehalogenase
MHLSDTPSAEKKSMTVNGQRMAYIDEREGDAIVFLNFLVVLGCAPKQ